MGAVHLALEALEGTESAGIRCGSGSAEVTAALQAPSVTEMGPLWVLLQGYTPGTIEGFAAFACPVPAEAVGGSNTWTHLAYVSNDRYDYHETRTSVCHVYIFHIWSPSGGIF